MGTDKLSFAVDRAVDHDRKSRTGSHVPDVPWPEPVRKYVLCMRNRSCAISTLVGPFHWKSRDWKVRQTVRNRKYVLRIPGFFPGFPRFFLTIAVVQVVQ